MPTRANLYPLVARFWSLAFLIAGVLFAVALSVPGLFASLAPEIQRVAGLRQPVGGGAFWFAQTLAWVAIIAFCADRCARHPEQTPVLYALLTGKTVTTVVFLVAAIAEDPLWLAFAALDGFIVLSLWATHRWYVASRTATPAAAGS